MENNIANELEDITKELGLCSVCALGLSKKQAYDSVDLYLEELSVRIDNVNARLTKVIPTLIAAERA